ncbi:MAG: hypothetical protein Q4G52_04045, partial [Clostridia bacterium]|nr:hypothetical protein [Clostridia bacterium]
KESAITSTRAKQSIFFMVKSPFVAQSGDKCLKNRAVSFILQSAFVDSSRPQAAVCRPALYKGFL